MNKYLVKVKNMIVLERTIEVEAENEGEAQYEAEGACGGLKWLIDPSTVEGVEYASDTVEGADVELLEGEEPDEEV